jgi:hypothetical protein
MSSSAAENGFVPKNYAARLEIHCRAALSSQTGPLKSPASIKSNVCAKLRRNGPSHGRVKGWGRHFLPAKSGSDVGFAEATKTACKLNNLPRSVHYWTDVARFSRFYRGARLVPTTLSGFLKCEYFYGLGTRPRRGHFYWSSGLALLNGNGPSLGA